jgi:hypothetical protein
LEPVLRRCFFIKSGRIDLFVLTVLHNKSVA